MRGAAGHEGRLDDGEVVDDLVDPAVDGGREADLALARRAAPCRTTCDSGSHRYCRSSGRGSRSPRRAAPSYVQRRAAADALGPPGRAGGVDQRGEVVRAGLRRPARRRSRGRSARCSRAELRDVVEADHPVAVVGLAVDEDDLQSPPASRSRCRAACRPARRPRRRRPGAAGVREDERDVVGHRRRVDRGGGAAGAP